jgi:hypothetical protein
MSKIDGFLGGVLWVGVAVLLPMTALEPVVAKAAAPSAASLALDSCGGSPHLAMGCSTMSL